MTKTAVLIFGWNRPHYMQKMLKSVRRNKKLDTFVYLDFCEDVNKTKLLVQLCNLYIPHASVVVRQKRYGCQNNIDCARLQVFNKGYDRIIVLEDDFILSDHYFQLLQNSLTWCEKNYPIIGMVIGWTGFSNYNSYNPQQHKPYQLGFSRGHMLGYIMNKSSWNKMFYYYKNYMQITKNCLIDHHPQMYNKLRMFFKTLPVNIKKSQQWKNNFRNQFCFGQDRATVACMYAAGIHRANFNLSRLQYIGYVGVHAKIKDSINIGWSKVKISNLQQDQFQKQFQLTPQLKQLCL